MKISRNIATFGATLSFFIVGLSGVMMFFHLDFGGMVTLHEVIGLFMVALCILHIHVNFASFKKYFKNKNNVAILCAIFALVLTLLFALAPNPKDEAYDKLARANLKEIMQTLRTDEAYFAHFLQEKNLILDEDISLQGFIDKHKLDEDEVIRAVFKSKD